MNVAQETLGFRRAGFSPALSLLMSAFALPMPPAEVSPHLHRPTERSPTASGVRSQRTEVRERRAFSDVPNFDRALAASLRSLGIHRATLSTWPRRYNLDLRNSAPRPAFRLQIQWLFARSA